MLTCISTQKDSECFFFFCEHLYTLTKLTLIYLFDNKILKCILLFCIVSTVNIINNLFAFFVIYLFIILPLSVNLRLWNRVGKENT